MRRHLRPAIVVPAIVVALVALVVGLYLFQPWRVFTTVTVDEALPSPVSTAANAGDSPSTSSSASPASRPTSSSSTSASPSPTPSANGPVVLASGEFISHEHATSGRASIVELADGTRILRLEDLDTSDGPELEVWLTDQPVIEGRDGWGVFDDGAVVNLGPLKGNVGNQNYRIPADVDLASITSVSIWCARFRVSFGAAELVPAN